MASPEPHGEQGGSDPLPARAGLLHSRGNRPPQDPGALARARAELRARLEARRPELELEIRTRIFAISDPREVIDPTYAESLLESVPVALDYALEAIGRGEPRTPPPPPALLAQARMAARSGVGLDTVLRRYFAGYALLGEFVAAEAPHALPEGAAVAEFLPGRAALLDRLLAAVTEEYERQVQSRLGSAEERRTERVARLLAGELIDASELSYVFDGWHLALVFTGPDPTKLMRDLAAGLDRRYLSVRPDTRTTWAWLGGRRPLEPEQLERLTSRAWPSSLTVALGEPGEGLPGWRLTNRQAVMAMIVALRGGRSFVRYRDVAILAAVLQDDLLTTSLRQLYLKPLEVERDGGRHLRETLLAYFAAGHSVSSAASVLGVSRQTISGRLRAAEQYLGHSLESCAQDLRAALELVRLEDEGSGNLKLPLAKRIEQSDKAREYRRWRD